MGTRVMKGSSGGRGRCRSKRLSRWYFLPLLLPLLHSCVPEAEQTTTVPEPKSEQPALPPTPLFDPDSAYAFVARQVAFGPRVPSAERIPFREVFLDHLPA